MAGRTLYAAAGGRVWCGSCYGSRPGRYLSRITNPHRLAVARCCACGCAGFDTPIGAPDQLDQQARDDEKRQTREKWARDDAAGRAFPAAGDLLEPLEHAQPYAVPLAQPRAAAPVQDLPLFSLDLFTE